MKWQYKVEENLKVKNIICLVVIVLLIFSTFFSNHLEKLMMLKPNYEFSNETEIHFINVGQGDAIGIKFSSGETMLIDTGTDAYSGKLFNYLDNILLSDGIIDYLVLTHIDSDHSGNLVSILNNYTVKNFYRPQLNSLIEDATSIRSNEIFDNAIRIAKNKDIKMFYNRAGVSLNVGVAKLNWLSPINVSEDLSNNDYSPVIKLSYNGISALFTGDISDDVEEVLVDTYNSQELDIDILKIAHHGSNYSTSEKFLNATTPKYACISVGENTYGHPSNKLISRILEYDKNFSYNLYENLYTTLDCGNVIMTLTSRGVEVSNIANIDDYNFVPYYTYCVIFVAIITFYVAKPYMYIFKKNIRFIIQNKKFTNYLENEKDNQA